MAVDTSSEKFPRRIGLETEYGLLHRIETDSSQSEELQRLAAVKFSPFSSWSDSEFGEYIPHAGYALINGKRVYIDGNHLEVCTPECRTAWELIHYINVGDAIATSLHPDFIRNTIDPLSKSSTNEIVTFGTHLNFWTSPEAFRFRNLLVPHLISMQIFAGAGAITPPINPFSKGVPYGSDGMFHIAQRAPFMEQTDGDSTTSNRSMITASRESHGDVNLGRRLHLICCDALHSPRAEFLRAFTIDLALRGIEDGIFVKLKSQLQFDPHQAIDDLKSMAGHMGQWNLKCFGKDGFTSALELQKFYFETLKLAYYKDSDSYLKYGFDLWEFVLSELSNFSGATDQHGISLDNYENLLGVIDWVTKKWLIDRHIEHSLANGHRPKVDELVSHDIEYSRADVNQNRFHDFVQQFNLPTIYEPNLLEKATNFAPKGRPRFRGELAKLAQKTKIDIYVDWDRCTLFNADDPPIRLPDPNGQYTKEFAAAKTMLLGK